MKNPVSFLFSSLLVVTLVGCGAAPELVGNGAPSQAYDNHPRLVMAAPMPAPAPKPAARPPVGIAKPSAPSHKVGPTHPLDFVELSGSLASGSALANFRPPKKNGARVVTVPYRRFLLHGKGENALRDPELKAFVIFTHRPQDDAELKVYQAVCRQWVADFEDYASAVETARYIPRAKLTPFYWPTKDKEVTSGNCDTLYNYDYAFAAAVVGLVGKPMQSVGPILALQQSGEWLSLDISRFEPVDVQRAFLIWKTQIVSENPLSAKFTLVKFREYFRTLVNLYGESIAKYVKV